jgi:site-specific DNA-adenine methylase
VNNKFTEEIFELVNKKLQKTTIYNLDFNELLTKLDIDNSLLFLDPPYIKRPAGYKTISNKFYENFIKFINETKADILYTDIRHYDLDLDFITLRQLMQNVSPNRKDEYTKIDHSLISEVMYKNY